jgi:hypothetical protein
MTILPDPRYDIRSFATDAARNNGVFQAHIPILAALPTGRLRQR